MNTIINSDFNGFNPGPPVLSSGAAGSSQLLQQPDLQLWNEVGSNNNVPSVFVWWFSFCYCYMCNIKSLVCALVTSCVDYCSLFLSGLVFRSQHLSLPISIQNSATKILYLSRRSSPLSTGCCFTHTSSTKLKALQGLLRLNFLPLFPVIFLPVSFGSSLTPSCTILPFLLGCLLPLELPAYKHTQCRLSSHLQILPKGFLVRTGLWQSASGLMTDQF